MYPTPVFVSRISSTEYIPALCTIVATAVASVPPEGAVLIATVGAVVYPKPSLFKKILLINPSPVKAFAVAVLPKPTKFNVVIYPTS